jgi:hypothetical protein
VGGAMMYNPIKKIKQDYFSLESTLEIIFNISAIFFISLIYYIFIEINLIQSEFLLFINLIIFIFIYYLSARIFLSFPSPLKHKFAILSKEEPFIPFEEPARIVIKESVIQRSVLRGIGDERAIEPLIQALKDEKWSVRAEAASALGTIGDERAVEPLIQALKDEKWSVRAEAASALGTIGDERAVEPLIQVLQDKNEDARKAAKESIEKIRKSL